MNATSRTTRLYTVQANAAAGLRDLYIETFESLEPTAEAFGRRFASELYALADLEVRPLVRDGVRVRVLELGLEVARLGLAVSELELAADIELDGRTPEAAIADALEPDEEGPFDPSSAWWAQHPDNPANRAEEDGR